jgi:hypothetical protein
MKADITSVTKQEIPDEYQYQHPVLWLRRVVRVRTGLQLRQKQEVVLLE